MTKFKFFVNKLIDRILNKLIYFLLVNKENYLIKF